MAETAKVNSDKDVRYKDTVLEEGRKRFSEINESIRRSQTLLLLLIGINELLQSASISQASFGGFEVTKLTAVRNFIPAVLAYLFYSASAVWSQSAELSPKYEQVMSEMYPEIYNSEVNSLLVPIKDPIEGVQRGWTWPLYWSLIGITYLGVPAYITYSYCRILQFHDALVPIFLSMSLAALFVIYGGCLMFVAIPLTRLRARRMRTLT
jgi:hypothetical protein